MKFVYSKSYSPPAPVAEIWLGYPEAAVSVGPLEALLDTGADGSVIPLKIVEQIEAPMIDIVRVRGPWDSWRSARMFVVDIKIGDLLLPAVDVVGVEGNDVVLGRNVINRLRLVLNGPDQVLELFHT